MNITEILASVIETSDQAICSIPEIDEINDTNKPLIDEKLIALGQLVETLPAAFRNANPGIDWQGFIVLKNFIEKDPASVSSEVRMNTLTRHIPSFRHGVSEILQRLN